MPSILDLITDRETVVTATVAALRDQITALTGQLTDLEAELTELTITRKTLLRLTDQADASATTDPIVASGPYQKILTVFATATAGVRAKDVCLALGTGTAANDIESMRAKLKRLVTRQVLVETEPGLFTLAPTPSPQPSDQDT